MQINPHRHPAVRAGRHQPCHHGHIGLELIDFEFDQEYARQTALEIPSAILLKEGRPPDVLDVFLPNLRVDEADASISRIRFTRIENRKCVPLLVNYKNTGARFFRIAEPDRHCRE
ncbi:hypothetical protein LZA78_10110 [Sinirhodobacter sp. WL0062]|uniref:Uncharacterized protein n=1 Tax=Rhodobacter flavimaris TaxID=2907145 RepID=A0ABS8YZB1_9RHOB|nr:hypothetical protein [Sinirhodobacter sp. WL0062]MCE5973834.1 hypothetical protein [Sinirhodobacter sp. WL0062]